MTDNTQPEALRLADALEGNARTAWTREEAAAELRRQHARIAELEAQLEAIGADSVLEDAARYRLVRRGQHWSVIDGIGNDLRAEALDAAVDAARKQGATT